MKACVEHNVIAGLSLVVTDVYTKGVKAMIDAAVSLVGMLD